MKLSSHGIGASPPAFRALPPFVSSGQASLPRIAVEKWENEGGRVEHPVAFTQRSVSPSSPRKDEGDMAGQLRLMSGTLAQNYANGRVSQRFNTYAHRSRVIRQMTAELRKLESDRQGSFRRDEND
jgi:hypothetical protein